MALNMTQEISSAQPRPRTPLSSPFPTQEHGDNLSADDINTPFAMLNNDALTEPYNTDQGHQADFERALADSLMHLMMNVRAWAEARPAHEASQEKDHLISEIRQIEGRQHEQGMSISFWETSRQRLVGFVASVKSALENLQG